MRKRQLINISRPSQTSSALAPSCSAFTLPSEGLLTLNSSTTITLASDAIYQPKCTGSSDVLIADSGAVNHIHFRDPFYASTLPECYALAATTVIAYMLVIMLLITPRTFIHEGALVLGRRGFTNGPSGSDAGIGIGGRPWLQKVAALTVAISLTIASADTFRVAEAQYEVGYMDAQALQKQVEDGTQLKVIRIISDTFLWLAQAQTLIRLFPRQREKIIIKWTAFALITLDELFSILNNFSYESSSRPRSFVDAVPALAYLFQLALSLLYAAWVIYYSVTKKTVAFYHPQMKNICLVALLSLVSVLVPVVFFVTDISKPDLAGWGDYVRWVGAAAASVVVWEWVERIEAMERNDKRDGVLGREIFDGDEMLDISPSSDMFQTAKSPPSMAKRNENTINGNVDTGPIKANWLAVTELTDRFRIRRRSDIESGESQRQTKSRYVHGSIWPSRHPTVKNPISYVNTTSADSTVYSIKYHSVDELPSTRIGAPRNSHDSVEANLSSTSIIEASTLNEHSNSASSNARENQVNQVDLSIPPKRKVWSSLPKINSFKIRGQGISSETIPRITRPQGSAYPPSNHSKWKVRRYFEDFASTQTGRLRQKTTRRNVSADSLPKTVIPAPPRRKDLSATFQELDDSDRSKFVLPNSSMIWAPSSGLSHQRSDDQTYLPPEPRDAPSSN
ncbi:pH-response regulator protein palH/RIM21 [Blumeria hordei DH14]|uniref:pH-response regulator protein palH/RIM21 n=1 Tax=Blumeria graminis f. sp. hordei (strain DH14) TaxID=546991 RepID=N1JB58_BLUG1|nr:pH-response regulator protein palH/RIM21 [Blumeria hordei DH14]